MNPCASLRAFLYSCLFSFCAVLLGLTGYRVHYTKKLRGGDILTKRSDFYDPVVVELLVTSALGLLFSLWLLIAILARIRGPAGNYMSEHILLWTIWVMFLVGGAVYTHKFRNLKWCRDHYKVCRILETIKAFAWICWGFVTIMIISSLAHMFMSKQSMSGPVYGGTTEGTYPEAREARTGASTGATTYVAHNNRTTQIGA